MVTRYEILRGLKVRDARSQLDDFEARYKEFEVLPVTAAVIERAADVYADLHRRGLLIGDCDILIAATALEYGLVVSTNNEAHFRRVPGLTVDNWLK